MERYTRRKPAPFFTFYRLAVGTMYGTTAAALAMMLNTGGEVSTSSAPTPTPTEQPAPTPTIPKLQVTVEARQNVPFSRGSINFTQR